MEHPGCLYYSVQRRRTYGGFAASVRAVCTFIVEAAGMLHLAEE